MSKAFLSHSSKQKKSYVDIVARQLGINNCVYDSLSFEEGMKNLEEIERGMNASDLFVIFLSDSALDSKWVRKEILESKELVSKGIIKRIFPIIIDDTINHTDSRIPDWMRDEYNLQYISRPTVATRRIKQRLIEISWNSHPVLKKRQNLFVGRNTLIRQFEERIDSFENPSPVSFFACGFTSIGRRSFIHNALKKANIIRESYSFPTITLEIDESIEDFILKLYDLGMSDKFDIGGLMYKKVDDKIDICSRLIKDISGAKEILQIIDNGGLISPYGELCSWFEDVIKQFETENKICCVVASKYRLHRGNLYKKPYILSIDIPELDYKERIGLLKRYAEINEVELDEESISLITNNLQGFPEQVFFTIDSIKEYGLPFVKKNPNIIIEYNSEKVKKILSNYESSSKALDFLNLLSQFDFISLEYIFDIVGEDDIYKKLLHEFYISAICEPIGSTKEYLRVNDTIRDHVSRNRIILPKEYYDKIKAHTVEFIKGFKEEDRDISDYIYSIKNAIIDGINVPNEHLIPSHFLKSMNELYDKGKRHGLIIELADRVLANSQYMDTRIENEIRYKLCVSLARIGDADRFFKEVNKIESNDYYYLLGFYHRLSGNSDKALENLNTYLSYHNTSVKGRRELMHVLMDIEEFDRALSLAKLLYENEKLNPYNIQPYIRCLMKVRPNNYRNTVENLIDALDKIKSKAAREMYLIAKANKYSIFDNNEIQAMDTINQCISEFPDNPYPLITKLEICEKFKDTISMEKTLVIFKQRNLKAKTYTNTTLSFEAKLLAIKGDKVAAMTIVDSKLNGRLPSSAIMKLKGIINSY